MNGVYIDMRNENALYTVSMLASFSEKLGKDYLDLLMPFIQYCLPQKIGAVIDLETLQKKMVDCGFESFPKKVIEKILDRMSKTADPIVEKGNGEKRYILHRICDNSDFDAARTEMRSMIDGILRELQTYLKNNHALHEYPIEDLREALIVFFEEAGLTVYKQDITELKEITARNGDMNFYIARFVINEFAKKSLTYEKLVRVVKGFMSYKAIYHITGNHSLSSDAKLKDVTFFLDCSLVIDALNFDSTVDFEAIEELIRLIRLLGGKVCVFRHTMDEAARTIEAFANHFGTANSFNLDNLAQKGYTKELILSLAANLDNEIKKTVSVPVVDAPLITERTYHIFPETEETIVDWLTQHRSKSGREENWNADNSQRHYYDAKSLVGIASIRNGTHPQQIERAKAILLTQDNLLYRCLRDLCGDKLRNEVPYTISDIDLAAILWLRTNKANSLPNDILIANASAACQPSHEVMERAIELAGQMVQNGDIPTDAVAFVGNCTSFKPYITAAVAGTQEELTAERLKRAVNNFVSDVYSEQLSEANKQHQELESRIHEQKDEEIARIYEEFSQQLQEKNNTISQLQAEIRRQENTKAQERDAFFQNAEDKSKNIARKWGILMFAVLILLSIVIVAVFAIQAILQNSEGSGLWWINLIVAAVGAIGGLALLLPKKALLRVCIKKIENRIQMRQYTKIVDKRKTTM